MSKTVVVTGGAGFIGSNFVHFLASRYPEYRIFVLDQLTYAGSIENLLPEMRELDHPQYKFWYGNVCNAELVRSIVQDADFLVHFAAETHVTRSIFDNLLFYETDVLGTQTVANAVLETLRNGSIERFVHISTSEVYGTAETEKMDEDHPLNPMSPYASAKTGADRMVYSYWATYEIPAVIIRPFNTFGPRQHLEKLIPRFITSTVLNEPLTVHGEGTASRDFVFVEDLCRAIDAVLHAPGDKVIGEAFNVATGVSRSVLDIARDILELTGGAEDSLKFVGDRPGQVFRHTGDASKIHSVLGWQPEVSWRDGLQRTVEWYKNNRPWWQQQLWMRAIPITSASGKREMH